VIGSDDPVLPSEPEPTSPVGDLLVERELWRVEAGRGGVPAPAPDGDRDGDGDGDGLGVFDLSFDWNAGSWQLVGCVD
jgi:hypothetical protein